MAGYLIVGTLMELSPLSWGISPYSGEFICQSNLESLYPTFLQGQVYKTILIWHVGYSEEILRFLQTGIFLFYKPFFQTIPYAIYRFNPFLSDFSSISPVKSIEKF